MRNGSQVSWTVKAVFMSASRGMRACRWDFQVLPEFTVVQHERDAQLLHAIKAYFGCGVVRKNHGDRMAYRVRERKQLIERIVPFFVEHPLRSKKRVDFEKFRDVLLLMEKDEHLTQDGVERIRRIAEQMNRGSQDRVQPARKLVGEN